MNGILVSAGEKKTKNIGDYVQSLAQEQFWDKVDCYVEREELSDYYSEEPTNLIMNAWYMWHPEKFPPSPSINPLLVSVHIAPSKAEKMLTAESVSYLKRYEPIGARDLGTLETLEKHGVKSYFSGCLTLTLGKTYKSDVRNADIIFVDPFVEMGGRTDKSKFYRFFRALYLCIKNLRKVFRLYKKFTLRFNTRIGYISRILERLLMCASFYNDYSPMFSDDVIFGAEYITHDVLQNQFRGHDDKMNYARILLQTYAKAKFVVTSRIHCALPCLGLETPVIFVTSENLDTGKTRSGGRFKGLLDFFHVMTYNNQGLAITSDYIAQLKKEEKIGEDFLFVNKDDYKVFANDLQKRVEKWIDRLGDKNAFPMDVNKPYRDNMIKRTSEFEKSSK